MEIGVAADSKAYHERNVENILKVFTQSNIFRELFMECLLRTWHYMQHSKKGSKQVRRDIRPYRSYSLWRNTGIKGEKWSDECYNSGSMGNFENINNLS